MLNLVVIIARFLEPMMLHLLQSVIHHVEFYALLAEYKENLFIN